MKTLTLLLTGVAAATCAMAQISVTGSSLTYSQDFNTLDTANLNSANLPAGWAIKETGNSPTTVNNQYKGNTGTSTTGDTYSYGSAGSTDRALGSIASTSNRSCYGARFINNTTDTIISFALSYNGEQWRRGSATSPDSLLFSYSLNADSLGDAAAMWIPVNALSFSSINMSTTTGTALNGNLNTVAVSGVVNQIVLPGEILTFKWNDIDISGSDDGLAIDDLSVTFTTASPPVPDFRPSITALNPADNSIAVPAGVYALQIVFDRQVTVGTGNLTIKNETDHTQQTIAVSSATTTISQDTATLTGAALLPGKAYHILLDSTSFDTAGYRCWGVYDTTAWNFSTLPAPPPVATSLDENFDTSCGSTPSGLPAGWMQYSVAGINQKWECTNNGNNGTPGVQMNGYSGQSGNVNEDWLITPSLNLASMSAAYLHFDHWKRFASSDELQVLLSHSYTGSGDPSAAVWINLNAISSSPADTAVWNSFETALTAHTAQPFYLAFKYVSTTADGYQSRLDNVFISPVSTGAATINRETPAFVILGHATTHEIIIGVNAAEGYYTIEIYDIIGKKIHEATKFIQTAMRNITLSGLNLPNGLYVIRLRSNSCSEAHKVILE